MKIVNFFLILFLSTIVRSHWLKLLYEKVLEETEPYQIMTFIGNHRTDSSGLMSIINEVPCYNFVFDNKHSRMIKKRVSKSLIILNFTDFRNTDIFIDFIDKLRLSQPRPRCLVIFPHCNTMISYDAIGKTLHLAWEKRFLDFSIVVEGLEDPVVYSFDPFYATISKRSINQEGVKIFPEKLMYVNNFDMPFYIHRINERVSSLHILEKNKKTRVFDQGPEIASLIMTSMGFNVSLIVHWDLRKPLPKSEMQGFYDVRSLILFDILVPSGSYVKSYVAFVPINRTSQLNPLTILLKILAVFLLVLGFAYIVRNLKITNEFTETFDMVKVFMGQSLSYELKRTPAKILFSTIVLLYVFIMDNLNSDIVSAKYGIEQASLGSFKELAESDLDIFFSDDDVNSASVVLAVSENEYLRKISKKVRFIITLDDCFKRLAEFKDCICFATDFKGITSYVDSKGLPAIGKVSPPLVESHTYYIFAAVSPYTERFHEILLRVRQAGLDYGYLIRYGNYTTAIVPEEHIVLDENVFEQITAVLVFGYLISSFVFFVELIIWLLNGIQLH